MRWRTIAGCVLALFVVYSVRPTGSPLYSAALVTTGGLFAYIVRIALRPEPLRIDPVWVLPGAVILTYLGWVLLRAAASEPLDLNLFKSSVSLVLTLIPAAVVVDTIANPRREGMARAVKYLYLAFVLQAIVTILAFLSPSVRSALISAIPPTGNLAPMHPLRMRGISHSGGSFVAASQAIGLLVGTHLFMSGQARTAVRTALLVGGMCAILVSILLTGRTGFLILPFLAIHVSLWLATRQDRKVRIGPMVTIILICIGGAFAAQAAVAEREGSLRPVADRALAEFETDSRGAVKSRTIEVLFGRMWFYPESAKQFVVGDAATWHEKRIRSDLGVIRRLHATGMIGVFLAFAVIAALAYPALIRSTTPNERRLVILVAIWAFVLEFKEPLALTSGVAAPIIVLSVAASRFKGPRDEQ